MESAQGLGDRNWAMLGLHLGGSPDLRERIHALEYHSLFRIAPSCFFRLTNSWKSAAMRFGGPSAIVR
jgi:hypothetical protein